MHEADLLKLTQWLSPGFPVSSYAYSHGLEAEIDAGRVRSARDLEDWVTAVLAAGAGRNDTIVMLAARRGTQGPEALSDLACALAGSRERLEENAGAGSRAGRDAGGTGRGGRHARPYPVALGWPRAALICPTVL